MVAFSRRLQKKERLRSFVADSAPQDDKCFVIEG
jgi:hypothetical protein